MAKSIHRVSVVVARIESPGTDVKVVYLQDKEGWELPPFTAGSHVDVHLPSGCIRQYSLCGDPANSNEYRIAVARDSSGRGGSMEIHDSLQVGQELLLSLPRNTFPVLSNVPVIMIAGGIGVTPFLSALTELKQSSQSFHLHYCTKTKQQAVFTAELADLSQAGYVSHYSSQDGNRANLQEILTQIDPETHVYCCGPARMTEACEAFADKLGERLHIEHFQQFTPADPDYEIELARSGRVIQVAAGQTMLQALRQADVELPASCEAGICLDCKCKWLSGNPIHRELTMPKGERSQWITPCVSGSAGSRITLDL